MPTPALHARSATVAVLVTLLGAALAPAQEKAALALRYAVGDRQTVTLESSVDATVTAREADAEGKAGRKPASRSLATTRKETFREEIVAVSETEGPTQVRLECVSSRAEERVAGLPPAESRGPLEGGIFTVTRKSGQTTAAAIGAGDLPARLAAPLGRWHDLRAILKPEPVAVGESWDAPAPAGLCALATGDDAGAVRVTCTLTGIARGTPDVAEIALRVAIGQGKEGDLRQLKGELTGKLTLDLSAGKPRALVLGGSLQGSREYRDTLDNAIGSVTVQAHKIDLKAAFAPAQ